MKKLLLSAIVFLPLFTTKVFAADLEFDLKAKGFADTNWQDNLSNADILFGPGDKLQYQVIVKNTSDWNQTQIKVDVTLPDSVTVNDGPDFTIDQIVPGDSYVRAFDITVKDKSKIKYDITKNTISAFIKADSGATGSDSTSFYTNQGALQTETKTTATKGAILPATGTSVLFGSLFGLSSLFGAISLRKKIRGF